MTESKVLSDTDIELKVTEKVGKSGLKNATVSVKVRLLGVSTTPTVVTVEPGFEDLVVYVSPEALGGLERIGTSDECLYLSGPSASGTLPATPKGSLFVAVDLKGARANQEVFNVRDIIQTLVQVYKTSGPASGGIGPVSSHP
jgi:hypothetical protein